MGFHTLLVSLLVTLLISCGLKGNDTADSGAAELLPCNPCAFIDDNNFQYTSSLDVKMFEAAEGQDVLIDWNELDLNILGETIAPETVTEAALIIFQGHGQDEVIDGLLKDTLPQLWVSVYLTCTPVSNACFLSEFSFMGTSAYIQKYFTEEWGGTWLITLMSEDVQGAETMAFLEPSATSQNVVAEIDSETAILTLEVDLELLIPVVVEPGETNIVVDWSGLTRTGVGSDIDLHRLDRLMLARFDEDRSELEAGFKQLESMADETWEVNVEGITSFNLSGLAGDTAFEGVDDNGLYYLGLFCTTCNNPMPYFLTEVRAAN